MSEEVTAEQYAKCAADYEEIEVAASGKRCGIWHDPWMGDWHTSWSPRNGNNNAEGPWEHWVDLAVRILQDPMTAIVRPDAHEAGQKIDLRDFYDDCDRRLTEAELLARFAPKAAPDSARDALDAQTLHDSPGSDLADVDL